jgi:hypothetical protein
MTPQQAESVARSFVDRVLELQRDMGLDTAVSSEDYDRAIESAADAFADLTDQNERREPVPA